MFFPLHSFSWKVETITRGNVVRAALQIKLASEFKCSVRWYIRRGIEVVNTWMVDRDLSLWVVPYANKVVRNLPTQFWLKIDI